MQRKIFAYAFLPAALGFGLVSVNVASAHGWFGGFGSLSPQEVATRQQTMFQAEAQILGVTVEEIKNAWAEGKSTNQLAEEKGITQEQLQTRAKAVHLEQIKSQLQVLVDQGVITQAQADARLKFMQQRMESRAGRMGKRMHWGFGR